MAGKERTIMKMMIVLQRILALVAIIIGIVLMLSEVPMGEGLLAQAWLTCGGLFIVLLSIGWEWLINKEEGFIHETR